MKAISVIVFLLTGMVCYGNILQNETILSNSKYPPQSKVDIKKDSLTYKIITNANKTFGYDILKDGKVMIHQASIPAVPGNQGFNSKASAKKVALLVIYKIKMGEMPPTVTVKEIKDLGVNY